MNDRPILHRVILEDFFIARLKKKKKKTQDRRGRPSSVQRWPCGRRVGKRRPERGLAGDTWMCQHVNSSSDIPHHPWDGFGIAWHWHQGLVDECRVECSNIHRIYSFIRRHFYPCGCKELNIATVELETKEWGDLISEGKCAPWGGWALSAGWNKLIGQKTTMKWWRKKQYVQQCGWRKIDIKLRRANTQEQIKKAMIEILDTWKRIRRRENHLKLKM